jgi:hypothetical protein
LSNDDNTDGLPLPIKAVAASGTTSGGGAYTLNTDGSFTYTPLATYTAAIDRFPYRVTDGKALSAAPASVTISLATPSAPSLTSLDGFGTGNAANLGINWSQAASSTTSAPDIGTAASTAVANATAVGGLAIWNEPGSIPLEPVQGAGAILSANAYIVLKASGGTVIAPANYVRVGCESGQVVVSTMMGGSNASVFVKQAAFGACSTGAMSAVVDAKGLVTVFQGSAFAGGVQLPDVAAWKGGGRIGIQLTAVGATADSFAGGTVVP